MNDYKELISSLRRHPDYKTVLNDREKAADAIEQLVRERDALNTALEDVIQNATSHCWLSADTNCKCSTEYGEKCEEWQWRGVDREARQ